MPPSSLLLPPWTLFVSSGALRLTAGPLREPGGPQLPRLARCCYPPGPFSSPRERSASRRTAPRARGSAAASLRSLLLPPWTLFVSSGALRLTADRSASQGVRSCLASLVAATPLDPVVAGNDPCPPARSPRPAFLPSSPGWSGRARLRCVGPATLRTLQGRPPPLFRSPPWPSQPSCRAARSWPSEAR